MNISVEYISQIFVQIEQKNYFFAYISAEYSETLLPYPGVISHVDERCTVLDS